jgi:hypothetical protein
MDWSLLVFVFVSNFHWDWQVPSLLHNPYYKSVVFYSLGSRSQVYVHFTTEIYTRFNYNSGSILSAKDVLNHR